MFRASNAHLQEDTVVYMQRMAMSLSTGVRGGLSVHSLSENSSSQWQCHSLREFVVACRYTI